MDRWRYFDITHKDHSIMNPISGVKLDEVFSLLNLREGARVLDIGCGKAEPLVRLAERYHINGIGVDPSPQMIAEAKRRTTERVSPPSRLEFELSDGRSFCGKAGSFDLAICLGASWAFDGYRGTLGALAGYCVSGGLILVGEPYWQEEPHPQYLNKQGVEADQFSTYAGNIRQGQEMGLTPLYAVCGGKNGFDAYLWLQVRAAERFARENPHDEDVGKILRRVRTERDMYLDYGRDALGWALYLFLK